MRTSRTCLAMVLAATIASGCVIEERADRNNRSAEAPKPHKEAIQPEGVARLPVFSTAIRSGDFIFLSGALGALPGVMPPTLVEGGIVPEAHMTMQNIETALDAAGATWDDVVKCTIFLADMADYGLFNDVYMEYMPEVPPARSALATGGLAFDARVEVECIAAAPPAS